MRTCRVSLARDGEVDAKAGLRLSSNSRDVIVTRKGVKLSWHLLLVFFLVIFGIQWKCQRVSSLF